MTRTDGAFSPMLQILDSHSTQGLHAKISQHQSIFFADQLADLRTSA